MPRQPTVLLVEDNAGDVCLLQEGFWEIDFAPRLEIAHTGEAALACLRAQTAGDRGTRPDLILLDLNMPGLHGLEILQIIRQDSRLNSIPVIILTSSANEQDVASARALNVQDYIIKPNDFDQWLTVASQIAQHCERLCS
jgi:CheY-like chemotaxis protein